MHKAIVNTNTVTPNGIIYDGKLVVENNRIFDILEAGDPIPADAEIIDAMGAYAGPGFVDIHVHGFGSRATYDADAGAIDHFLSHGTTTLLATPYYSLNLDENLQAIQNTKQAIRKSHVVKGIYMEGPYTNPNYGANADTNPWRLGILEKEYKVLVDACGKDVMVWTIAPELEGIQSFCSYARQVNPDVVIALGHSEATPYQVKSMGKYRPTLMTHTMNATGRSPVFEGTRGYGPDEYCFSHPDMYAELICDSCGIHVDAALRRPLSWHH